MLAAAGDYAVGDIVEVTEKRARGLIATGYAAEVDSAHPNKPGAESAMQQHQSGQKGRGGVGRERR